MTPESMTLNGREYRVRKLLGKGKGGYSWLVEREGRQYVLKQIHHEPCDYYQFDDKFQSELRDYKRLKEIGIPIPELLEADREREYILKEYVEGETIDALVARDKVTADHLEQVTAMCAQLYPANTNIDYFPTNFVVREGRLVYIDFECNDYMEQWDFEHWGIRYWSRTPEFLAWQEEKNR